jgi:hypothetical protein
MALPKTTQVYLSIFSVFLLTIVGSSAYILQSGSGVTSQADTKIQVINPKLSLLADHSIYAVGETVNITIKGSFKNDPVTGGQILLSYPNKSLQFVSADSAGQLGTATVISPDPATGTVSLKYLPLVGYTGRGGIIAQVKFKAISAARDDLTLETVSQLPGLLPTSITTVSQTFTPDTQNTSITIE